MNTLYDFNRIWSLITHHSKCPGYNLRVTQHDKDEENLVCSRGEIQHWNYQMLQPVITILHDVKETLSKLVGR
jgi:hypothetical protein